MKVLVIIGLIVCLFIIGCTPSYELPVGYNKELPLTVTVTPIPKVIDVNDITFVYPSKLCLVGMGINEYKDFKIQVHNGTDSESSYEIYYQQPSGISSDQQPNTLMPMLTGIYQPAPDAAKDWIKMNNMLSVQSKWTENIEVQLNIPDKIITSDKWYFYIAAKESNQGNVGVANAATVFVNMK